MTIRRRETQLWERGVSIRSPRQDATLYRQARTVDASLASLCQDYSRLATRYREKRELELTRVELYRQGQAIAGKLKRVQEELEAIRDEEGRVGL